MAACWASFSAKGLPSELGYSTSTAAREGGDSGGKGGRSGSAHGRSPRDDGEACPGCGRWTTVLRSWGRPQPDCRSTPLRCRAVSRTTADVRSNHRRGGSSRAENPSRRAPTGWPVHPAGRFGPARPQRSNAQFRRWRQEVRPPGRATCLLDRLWEKLRTWSRKGQERGAAQSTVSPLRLRGWAEREETDGRRRKCPEPRCRACPASHDGARLIGSMNVVGNSLREPA